MSETKYSLDNLVVLRIESNSGFPKIIGAGEALQSDPNLTIDVERGIWDYKSYKPLRVPGGQKRDKRFGESIEGPDDARYVIGVYDRTDNKHLNSMAFACVKRASERNNYGDI